MLLYHYRALDGTDVPALHNGDKPSLMAMHVGSLTPIVSVLTVDDPLVRAAQRVLLQRRLVRTPASQTGLRHSLEWVLKGL